MKPLCILFLLDWRPIFWSTREEFYAQLARRLQQAGVKAVMTISADIEPRVRERLEEAGAEVNVFPYSARYAHYFSYIAGIARRYTVLLAHVRFFDYFSLIPWLCRLNGIRTIVFTESNGGEFAPGAAWKSVLLRLRAAIVTTPLAKAIAISTFIRRRLIASGIPTHKTCVIFNGIDTETFAPDRSQRFRSSIPSAAQHDRFLVAFVSALKPLKRPELVIQVCQQLVNRGIAVTILAAGDGPLQEAVVARTRELGLDGHLHWLGHHPNPQHLLQASDAFLHTTLGEAFGNVLAEAMACAVPIVATRSGGTPEVVSSDCAILTEPGEGEPTALVDALETLAGNPDLRQKMGLAGRERACRLFSTASAVEANIDLYRELLKGTPGLPAGF